MSLGDLSVGQLHELSEVLGMSGATLLEAVLGSLEDDGC